MHFAGTFPEDDFDVCVLGDVTSQIPVGYEDHPLDTERFDHFDRVRGSAADIRFRTDVGIGVDVGDHRYARMLLAQGPHIGTRD